MENFVVITVGEQEYGFKFTMKTLEVISEKTNLEYHELVDYCTSKPFSIMNVILLSANKVYNKGAELGEYEVDDLIEEMDADQLQEVWDAFEKSFVRLAEKMKAMRKGAKKK